MKNLFNFIAAAMISGSSFLSFAQVTAGDCAVAVDICTNANFQIDPNGFGNVDELGDGSTTGLVSNPSTNPNVVAALGTPNSGCLLSGELNSTWMIINISSNGALEFSFGADNGSNCYDWIMWQYDANACSNIQNNLQPPVACNWNGMCEGFTGMAGGPNGSGLPTGGDQSNFEDALNVVCGEQYIVCFSNFSSATTSVPLNFFGSAGISCTTYNPIAVNDTTVCEGVCVTLTATGANTYNWTPNPDLSATTGASVTACPPSVPGTYDYYVTGTGTCGTGTDTASVTVVALGNPTITPVGSVAPTDPPFPMVGATPGGTWSSNCGPCIDPVTGVFDPSVAGTGTWQVCYTVGAVPCDSTDCIDVVVGCVPPVITPLANVTECDTYILPAITGTGLSGNEAYYTGMGATGTQYNAGDAITSTVTLYIYDETAPGSGCSDEEPVTITIHISPNAGADNNTVLCNTATTLDVNTMLNGADPGGNWVETTVPASGQFNVTTGVFDPTGLPGGVYTFTYTVPGTAPCVDDVATMTVGVVAGPPTLNCPAALTTQCSIADVPPYQDLAAFTGAGGTANDPSGQLDPTSFTMISEVSDGNSCPEIVTRTYEIANLCGLTATCTQTITINDDTPPTASNPAAIVVACPTDVPAPDVTVVTDEADNCTAAPIVAHVSDVSDNNTCNNETITRTYSVTDDCGNTINVIQTITISASSNAVDAGNNLQVCEGDNVILTASNAPGATISWNNGVVDGVAFVPPLGITTYTVTADYCNGLCVSTDTVTVEVSAAPVVSFTADTLAGCAPLTVNFTNTSTPVGTNCQWDFGNGNTAVGCGTVSNYYPASGFYDVSLTVTNAIGCSTTETYQDYIEVYQTPLAQFQPSPGEVDIENTSVFFVNNSVNATDYIWDFGDGSASSTEETPTHEYPAEPNSYYTVHLTAISENGCIDTTTRTVVVKDIILYYVPNTFTPDDDEFNQTWHPIFTSGFDPHDFTVRIYDRWGEVIWESHDATVGWDGTYGSSIPVADGTYNWTIEFKETMSDKRHTVTGHVTIIR